MSKEKRAREGGDISPLPDRVDTTVASDVSECLLSA